MLDTIETDIISHQCAICPFCGHIHDDCDSIADIPIGISEFFCVKCNSSFFVKCTPIVYEYITNKDLHWN